MSVQRVTSLAAPELRSRGDASVALVAPLQLIIRFYTLIEPIGGIIEALSDLMPFVRWQAKRMRDLWTLCSRTAQTTSQQAACERP